jgi:lipoprotein-anchoring transpeptidase ErfK/SrfK
MPEVPPVASASNAVVLPAAVPVLPVRSLQQVETNALTALVNEADAAEKAGRQLDARTKWLQILDCAIPDALRARAEERLGQLNSQLVLTPAAMPEKTEYVVKAGDSFDKLAKRFKTTVELLQKGNNTADPSRIRQGDHLRILSGRFTIEVSRSRRDLLVLLNGKFFKRYMVGIGKYDKTPLGGFSVVDKIKEPVWWRPDGKSVPFGHPENILGTRWMSIRAVAGTPDVRGYGIHGTWDNASVGKSESAGCVRMRNAEVEELFSLVPLGTSVTIRD